MFRLPAKTLRAAAFTISALLATAVAAPAAAQVSVSIGFDNFHNRLSPYGTWSNNARWGEVWRPRAERGFRPYYNGHWEDTQEYGWFWVSEDSWGDIPYHYGRWVNDPREGWLWVPGYVWGPSWVVWREGGGNIGWFPMPPGDDYYGDGAYRDNFDTQYGYRDWYGPSFSNDQFLSLWIFVGEDHFRDRNYRNYAVPQRDYGRFFSQTRNTTNYVTINNYVVNRSVDDSRFRDNRNQRIQPVPARNVIGRDVQAQQANAGRQIEQRERQRHPIPVNINPAEQRGRGNVTPNAQQQNPVQAPQVSGGRGGDREPNSSGPRNVTQPLNRGVVAAPPTPAAPAAGTPPNGRGPGNPNPAAQRGPAEQKPNGPGPSNVQAGRGAPAAIAPAPNANTGPRDNAERNNRVAAPDAKPTAKAAGPANPRAQRGAQPPQARGAVQPAVQEARTPPRVPANGPAGDGPGNARNGQARGNGQGDAKKPDDPKPNGDKKDGPDRGRDAR